jgi:nitrogen PTS system EIIA component
MSLAQFLRADAIIPALKAVGKKQALQELAHKASELTGLDEREIFDTLLQRERLGSTGVGDGIAIPHGKLSKLTAMTAIFARLEKPVEFEAIDGAPVDLIFMLLAPEGAGADHLKALARVARVMRDAQTVESLRKAKDPSALYAILTQEGVAATSAA